VGDYASLRGGEGPSVVFRPDRYRPSELGSIAATVEMTMDGHVFRSDLFDVSVGGAAFPWPGVRPAQIGMTVPELVVRFDEHEAYRGSARVSSLRTIAGATIAGVSLVDAALDIEALLRLLEVKSWTGPQSLATPAVARCPWRIAGHEPFKSLVAELRLLLVDAEGRLRDMEGAFRWAVTDGETDSPARAALVARMGDELARDVVAYSGELDAALRTASRADRDALGEFSARHLQDILMQAPWMHRARHKPLGYPGDFQVMNYAYNDPFSGPTLFAKALSLSFLSTPAARALGTRKELIKAQLRALMDDATSTEPLRILSVAAGPAQEIFELLAERRSGTRPLEIVLFDQDRRALSYAHGRLRRLLGAPHGNAVKLVYRHDSIKRLLLGADVFGGEGRFDAIYSCGLFDYLQTRTATALCRSLYALLAPGGTLYVGNMVPANPSRWVMELHLDWYLIYRELDELLQIGRAAAPDARIELLEEETRVNPFVALTRVSTGS
jgi:SAM-dependent methyltransferase